MGRRFPENMILCAADRQAEVVSLHAQGMDFEAISKLHGVSLTTSYRDWHRQIAKLAAKDQPTPAQARVAADLRLDGIAALAREAIAKLMAEGETRAVSPLINALVRIESLVAEIHGAKQVAAQVDVNVGGGELNMAAVQHLLGRAPSQQLQSAAVDVQVMPQG
jgi:hypothetical protein